jgi:hypothetical protein
VGAVNIAADAKTAAVETAAVETVAAETVTAEAVTAEAVTVETVTVETVEAVTVEAVTVEAATDSLLSNQDTVEHSARPIRCASPCGDRRGGCRQPLGRNGKR